MIALRCTADYNDDVIERDMTLGLLAVVPILFQQVTHLIQVLLVLSIDFILATVHSPPDQHQQMYQIHILTMHPASFSHTKIT